MIDLHLHLDGSLDVKDFLYLSNKEGIALPNDFPSCIHVSKDCKSLEEYLEKFALPISLMQSRENIRFVTRSLVNRIYQLGYIYAEIRFASQLHTNKGLTQVEVIEAALEGLKQGLINKPHFDVNLIICLMRQAPEEVNKESIDAVLQVNSNKVVAIDLAGPEGYKDTKEYSSLIKYAREKGLNVTIHAGEACPNESIMSAIDIGAMRIGHGVHLSFDEKSIKKVKDNHICFEFCPTSNIQTTSLPSYDDVPLKEFRKNQIPVSINSDNMSVSNTNVIEEFKHLINTFSLSEEDVFYYIKNALDMSFIDKTKKEDLMNVLNYKFSLFYQKLKA